MSQNVIIEYPFPTNLGERHYCVYPDALENDTLVLFHATPIENAASIQENGFEFPDPNNEGALSSISFAARSSGALSHAMTKRVTHGGDYCIFAVRYPALDYPHIEGAGTDFVLDYQLNPAPELIGFCIVPESYRFI